VDTFFSPPFTPIREFLIVLTFAMARMTGLIVIMPAFTRLNLTGILQAGTALVLALPLTPMLGAVITSQHLAGLGLAVLLFKEVIIGMVVGLVLGLPIWAAEAAGDILDIQRGSSAGGLFGGPGNEDATITGTLFGYIITALYFGYGGLPLTLRTVYDSYRIWPASDVLPTFNPMAGQLFVAMLDNIFTMGVVLVAPIIIFMLLTDILLALVSRAAPHLNVFALTLNVKGLVFTLLLALYGAFLLKYMGNDLSLMLRAGTDLENLAKPGAR
jgi:type III secretion protein T